MLFFFSSPLEYAITGFLRDRQGERNKKLLVFMSQLSNRATKCIFLSSMMESNLLMQGLPLLPHNRGPILPFLTLTIPGRHCQISSCSSIQSGRAQSAGMISANAKLEYETFPTHLGIGY
jgi:hypothetical protein